MRIALDVMGGDHAPHAIVQGAVEASLKLKEVTCIYVVGDEAAINAELAKYRDAPVVAYATTNEEGDLSMLFFDEQEARKYSGDDEPIKLIVKPGE